MAILNWDGLSHYDFKMKAKITEWLNGKAEKVHTHTKSEVGLDQVDNTSDADKPISTAQKKKFAEIDTAIAGKSPTGHKHTKSDITDFPTLGTASSKDVASTGNASATQVVMGNDSRLTDARKASDVQAWAKAENKPSYTKLEVGLGNVDNTSDTNKPVSTAQQTAIDTAYVNANKYTDKKVADLIGTAPETMDTLEEVAAAIQENKDVEKALNEAIGKKANQTELDTHTGNSTIHITASERTKWNAAKTHADSTHARTDATKVTKSTTNGNIKINDVETTVYTHPSSHSIAEVSGLQTALDGKGTYSKPSGGIPKSDLASAVQTSLGKADTALQSHQDISGKQDKSTAVTHKASTAVGSATQPVYIASDGSATATTYTLGKSVPSDAKFTDTNTITNLGTASNNYTNGNILIQGSGATSVTKSGNTITISSTDNNTVYTHPTTAGNKHIPSGGKSGQILRWSADGTASWGDDNNTWRGIQDNLLSTSTTDSLSANQGKILNETKMPHKTITTATDFNEFKETGVYHIVFMDGANQPTSNHGTLYVDFLVGTPYQLWMPDASNQMFKRHYTSGAWSGWTELKLTDTTYSDATTSAHGLMTAAMVTKLNGIASGANKTTVDSELSSTSTNPVQNKVINTALAGKANSSHGNHVPATQTANNATFLRNDNTWAKVTPANIGAQPAGSYAATSHTHDDRYYTESEINTKLNGKANSSHTHGNGDITSLDAGKITSGIISIDRLPQGALERLTVVADDTARFKLTSSTIQKGDTVKVTSSGKMYYVVDETKLSSEAGYEVYAAGTAASVPWSGVTGKPSTYTPSSHTHTKSQITDFPSSMKNPNSLTISLNGTSQGAYDGSTTKSINVTPSSIGAAAANHNHDSVYSKLGHTHSGLSGEETTLSSGTESNAITTKTNANGILGGDYTSIRTAMDFAWYGTHWQIGNIRGGSTDSVGFGFAFKSDGSGSKLVLKSYIDTNGVYQGKALTAGTADNANAVAWRNVSGKPSFATVATSGSYNDLSNKPTIPTIPSSLPANGGTATTISQKVNASSLSHTNYNTNGTYVPTMNFLSYWNGAYSSTGSSNLTYCKQGAFGTIITKSASDYAAASHSHTIANITNLQSTLNGKAASSHTHTKSEVGLGSVDNTADADKSVKYATSAGSAGSATKATAIVDYNQTSKNIQIGYAGDGIKGDAIKFIAGYTEGNGSDVTAKIKDVSKDALKSWLGLGSLAYSSASIPSVGNGTITITQNGTSKGSFTMNQSGNTTIALTDTNTDTNTVTNIGTASNNYTSGNILFQGSGATTVSKSGNTITISSTDTTYTLAGLMGSTAKGSSDYGVYWNGSSFVQTKHIPTVDNSATFTSGNPAASAAIMTNVLEHTMWLEKHVAISSYGTTTLCNLADQAASHTSGAYLVLISGMTSSCKSEIYLIYNMQNNNKTFYMQQVASAGGSSTACTLTISGTTLTATVQGNSAPYRNIFVFRCTI